MKPIRLAEKLNAYKEKLLNTIEDTVDEVGQELAYELGSNVPVDTGDLSTGFDANVIVEDDLIRGVVKSTATNENGETYWQYIENGTGVYNPESTRNGEPWRYKDSHGNWHTTYGMEADPFIDESMEVIHGVLSEKLHEAIERGR